MGIRSKTKYLVRIYLSKDVVGFCRGDIEYSGCSLEEAIGRLSPFQKANVTSFTIYENGKKVRNIKAAEYNEPNCSI